MYLGFSVLSQGCNCNVMSMLLPCSCSNYYTIFGFLFWQRLVDQRRGVSLFGVPPFLAPLHFSHLSFYVPSLQHEKVFLAIYLFLPPSTLSLTLCSLLHPLLLYYTLRPFISQFLFLFLIHLSSLCPLYTPQWDDVIITILSVPKHSHLLPFLFAFS